MEFHEKSLGDTAQVAIASIPLAGRAGESSFDGAALPSASFNISYGARLISFFEQMFSGGVHRSNICESREKRVSGYGFLVAANSPGLSCISPRSTSAARLRDARLVLSAAPPMPLSPF